MSPGGSRCGKGSARDRLLREKALTEGDREMTEHFFTLRDRELDNMAIAGISAKNKGPFGRKRR